MSRLGTLVALAAAAGAALMGGCHTCEDHDASIAAFDLAKFNYENGKYDQAKTLYSRCVEKCPSNEEGWLGLANSARECGNVQYRTAAELAGQGKIPDSKRVFKEASDNHLMSYEILQRKLRERPDDMAPHLGLGMFFYQRATSVLPFPWPIDDVTHRTKERDLAIAEFQLILSKGDLLQVHRYLGLALFAAGKMEDGRLHLQKYHNAQQNLYERVLQWPGSSDSEKKDKEAALTMINKEIDDIRDVLGEYFMVVNHDYDRLRLKKERTPEEEARMAKLKTESLQLEGVIKSFHLTKLGQVEQDVRRRCDEYLRALNQGQVAEIMSFAAPKQGEEAAFKIGIEDRVSQGTRIRKVRYRTIVVSGETASVALVCEVSSKKGTRPDAELTMHWRLVGGQWRVADLP